MEPPANIRMAMVLLPNSGQDWPRTKKRIAPISGHGSPRVLVERTSQQRFYQVCSKRRKKKMYLCKFFFGPLREVMSGLTLSLLILYNCKK